MNRIVATFLAVGVIAATAFAVWGGDGREPAEPSAVNSNQAAGPTSLALLTGLPLMFGEQFGLDAQPSPVLEELSETFDVQAISVADRASLAPFSLLLMAHPRAQPAEALVELDEWVLKGGRLLLLADPRLDWHSDRPLGDKLRPPPDFADTGLLDHWGLSLSGPTSEGPVSLDINGLTIMASSPGRLAARGQQCTLSAQGFIAHCKVGAGEAVVIADADFLNVAGDGALDGPTDRNLELVARELTRLAR